jgi:hypothetical protein
MPKASIICDIKRVSQLFQRFKSADMLEKSQLFEPEDILVSQMILQLLAISFHIRYPYVRSPRSSE